MEDCLEKWRYGVLREDQPKLQPLLEGLERLWDRGLTAAVVMAAFHRRRVLPLMARRRCLFEMRPDEPLDGVRMSTVALSDEEVLRPVKGTVDGWSKSGGLFPPDAPVAGVPLSGKSHVAVAPEASLFLTVFRSLICVRRPRRG